MATVFSSRTTLAPAMAPAEKPEKFFGVDFKRWHCLKDDLYNAYNVMKTSRELWNALEKKYKIEDTGLNKFVAAKFLDFKIVDDKPVITEVQELQDFKNYLKHKRNEMTLEDLIVRLRIEEDNKAAGKKYRVKSTIMEANIIEEVSTSNKKRKKSSGPKNYPSKKKFKGPDETIFMGNFATAKIEGVGKITLKMTSGKIVTLNNVLHVPGIHKNLVLIALATVYGLEIHQMNVKTTFLNGDLEKEIYMEQPEGFMIFGKEKKVTMAVTLPRRLEIPKPRVVARLRLRLQIRIQIQI
uniref:Reverse transcriptase Ty1/copia-type domain-containing protein n=1 Tax=Nicotiana tabacum TaxID=4097 RepID=A0A1S3YUZ8_TOBAC|nr:PREDICTED: uncharacterized protein LOC107779978 [Nicotiana tabacum]